MVGIEMTLMLCMAIPLGEAGLVDLFDLTITGNLAPNEVQLP